MSARPEYFCPECGCKVKADKTFDYHGYKDGSEEVYYFQCKKCNHKFQLVKNTKYYIRDLKFNPSNRASYEERMGIDRERGETKRTK